MAGGDGNRAAEAMTAHLAGTGHDLGLCCAPTAVRAAVAPVPCRSSRPAA
ncbi:hypothetical protein [Streptomyces sp. NBC_00876]